MMESRTSEKATEMFAVQPQIDTTGLCSEKQDQQAVLSDRGLDKKRAKDKARLLLQKVAITRVWYPARRAPSSATHLGVPCCLLCYTEASG